MKKTPLLFLAILIEGYVVLSCELLAMRLLLPFVGSGVEVVAIVISGILLPLAAGYHAGGMAHRKRARSRRKTFSPRALLLRNIVIALAFLAPGLSDPFLSVFFKTLRWLTIVHPLLQTGVYTALFLIVPTFLLGQTVPLLSNYFSRRRLSETTGRILFFSTAGSFLGSLFSTLLLMSTIGVHATVVVTLGLLFLLCLLLDIRKDAGLFSLATALMLFVVFSNIGLNSGVFFPPRAIVSANAYSTTQIYELDSSGSKLMMVNNSPASLVSRDPAKRFAYVRYIETNFLEPLQKTEEPKDILIIGAGGFTMGLDDTRNRYTFVDIDGDLKKVAEKHFLPAPLTANKTFKPMSARAFLKRETALYDLIILDVYTMANAIPAECTTENFLMDVKARLKPSGYVVANIIESPVFRDAFAVRYHNSFSRIFPVFSRQIIGTFDPWRDEGSAYGGTATSNVLYIGVQNKRTDDRSGYTDNLNTFSMDRD